MPEMTDTIRILIPLFNDWEAFFLLEKRMREVLPETLLKRIFLTVVNDCSPQPQPPYPGRLPFEVIELWRNVGHQKAIALGLAWLCRERDFQYMLVMDADGEDRPEDIAVLLAAVEARPGQIVFAHRSKRSEGPLFRTFYVIYKFVFQLLTGKVITFGNFSIIPRAQAEKLAHVSEIWNHFPGGIIRSRLPYSAVPIERGKRLAGESKMNFISLILHGMSAISVYLDTTAVRLVIGSFLLFLGVGAVMLTVTLLRLFVPEWTFPNWATTLVTAGLIIMLQAFMISLLMLFTVLSYRTQRHFVPATDFATFIRTVRGG